MMSYLHGTKHESSETATIEGILVYPVGVHSTDLRFEIDGFPIRIFTLDLSQPTTQGIERDLLQLLPIDAPEPVKSNL
jgi:hypothetical protein